VLKKSLLWRRYGYFLKLHNIHLVLKQAIILWLAFYKVKLVTVYKVALIVTVIMSCLENLGSFQFECFILWERSTCMR